MCHVIHSLQEGGAEHLLLTFADVAPTVGLDMSVLSLMPTTRRRRAEQLRDRGVDVATLDLTTRWDPRALPAAVRVLREQRVQVLHTHLKHADLVGAYASRRLHVPQVSTLHQIEDTLTPITRVKRRLGAMARTRVADRTITVSDAQRRWYLDAFRADPHQVVTVYNGVTAPPPADPAAVADRRAELGAGPDTIVVTMVAITRPGKGHDDLFGAVRALPDGLDVRVVVAGDGPSQAEVEAKVAADPVLRGRVRLVGFVEDVEGLLAATDVLVHPSHFDALPTAVIYALAAGLPVVGTDVGGIPEIVTPDVGVLVPPHDPAALGEALEGLCRDERRRRMLGQAARSRFDEVFDAHAWVGRLRRVYDEVLDAG